MTDFLVITTVIALLPLTAFMVIFQANPYHALVIRGILGAVAAMIYAILGAADVALTEALVGTMLATTLYAVAVRSSLVMRVGVLEEELNEADDNSREEAQYLFKQLMSDLRKVFDKYHLRVELVLYQDRQDLHQALADKEVHTTCVRQLQPQPDNQDRAETQLYHTQTRVQRLYEIMQTELSSSETMLTYVSATNSGEKP